MCAERCTAFITNFMDDSSNFKYMDMLVRFLRPLLTFPHAPALHYRAAQFRSCLALTTRSMGA